MELDLLGMKHDKHSNPLVTYILDEYKSKKKDRINWGNYFTFLQKLMGKKVDPYLETIVEIFIVLTDLVDDMMDKDNEKTRLLLKENQAELSEILFLAFTAIRIRSSKEQFGFFVDKITESLLIQYEESQYQVTEKSNEEDYFYLVDRSVYLMQSIIYLVDPKPSEAILEAVKLVAYNAQIENDINDLGKYRSFDLLDKKGTLPIIRTIEWAKKNDCTLFKEKFSQLNRKEVTNEVYDYILEMIKESGSIEYCRLLSLSFQIRALNVLTNEYPTQEERIHKFIKQ